MMIFHQDASTNLTMTIIATLTILIVIALCCLQKIFFATN